MRILFFVLCLVSLTALSQDNYLVTLKGDTLRGKVQIHSYDVVDRASVKGEGKKKTLTALELRNVFLDSALYVPVQYENTIRLMRIIKSGYLSLYAFKLAEQSTFDGRLLVKLNGEKLEVPNIQFKRILSNFLEDCAATAERVSNGDLSRNQVEVIVDDYNSCIKEKNQKTIIAASNGSPLTEAIYKLRVKVDSSSIESKSDVLDLLSTIDTKERLKEPIPGYLKDGLKAYLAGKKEFEEEFNRVMELVN